MINAIKYKSIALASFGLLVVFLMGSVGVANAEPQSVIGGANASSGAGDPAASSSYNCDYKDSCPRWFLVSQEDFQQIINGPESENFFRSKSDYPGIDTICKEDEHILIAGNLKLQGSNYRPRGYRVSDIKIQNIKNPGAITNYPQKHKSSHQAYSWVENGVVKTNGGVFSLTNDNPMTIGFFGEKTDSGKYTYGGLLKAIWDSKGLGNDTEIAVACESMLNPENPGEGAKYYSSSYAEIKKEKISGTWVTKKTETGIYNFPGSKQKATTEPVIIYKGNVLPRIEFKHRIFSSEPVEGVKYTVKNTYFHDGRELTYSTGETFIKRYFYTARIGETSIESGAGWKHVTDGYVLNLNNDYNYNNKTIYTTSSDPTHFASYGALDIDDWNGRSGIHFSGTSVDGEWLFCQTVFVDNVEMTTACAKIVVSPGNNDTSALYSVSNVSANRAGASTSTTGKCVEGSGDYDDGVDCYTTGIYPAKVTATTKKKAELGETVNLTFSHNLYSYTLLKDAVYTIERSVSYDGFTSESWSGFELPKRAGHYYGGYEITTDSSALTRSLSTNTLSSRRKACDSDGKPSDEGTEYCRAGEFVNSYTTPPYVSPPKYRDTKNGSKKYLWRDYYQVKFTVGGTYKFCETVRIITKTSGDNEGKGYYLTTSCAEIKIDNVAKCVPDADGNYPPYCSKNCMENAPPDYIMSNMYSGKSSVLSGVRNESIGNKQNNLYVYSNGHENSMDNGRSPVYAKPNDIIGWIHCYYPGAQTVANTVVVPGSPGSSGNAKYGGSGKYAHGEHGVESDTTNKGLEFWRVENFDHSLRVSSSNFANKSYSTTKPGERGDSEVMEDTNKYTVDENDVGKSENVGGSLLEKGETVGPTQVVANYQYHHWDCHCTTDTDADGRSYTVCDTCGHDGPEFYPQYSSGEYGSFDGQRSWRGSYDQVIVKVPYNYENTAKVKLDNTSYVYAGETVEVVQSDYIVGKRENKTLEGKYSTKVDEPKAQLIGYTISGGQRRAMDDLYRSGEALSKGYYGNSLCDDSAIGAHEECTVLKDFTTSKFVKDSTNREILNGKYGVFDSVAGNYFCVVMAIYPANSGNDTQMNKSGSGSWYISAPDCKIIAKKPSFEVWGGGMYAAKKVETNISTKNNLKGIYEFRYGEGKNVTFGSWVEHSLVANAELRGIASGASMGKWGKFSAKYNKSLTDSLFSSVGGNGPGGSMGDAYCKLNPLTMSNVTCFGLLANANFINNESYQFDYSDNKSEILDRYLVGWDGSNVDDVKCGDGISSEDCFINRALSIPADIVGRTIVLYKSGDYEISEDIVLDREYRTIAEIPKIIIYSTGNIKIRCNVERVDAVLIAYGAVDTCSDVRKPTSYNGAERAVKLMINGTVIANNLVLGRTYGAATGVNSGEPAEVINYDTSLYFWGRSQADVTTSGKLNSLYTYETAPRY